MGIPLKCVSCLNYIYLHLTRPLTVALFFSYACTGNIKMIFMVKMLNDHRNHRIKNYFKLLVKRFQFETKKMDAPRHSHLT